MVLEVAEISVQPGRAEEFLAALPAAIAVLQQAEGFIRLEAHVGEERPDTVLLLLSWRTLEDHTVGFRQGPLFAQWREHISPFFQDAPQVTHWHPALNASASESS